MPYFSKRFFVRPETLADLYWTKGLSSFKIGKHLGLASRTVNIRMRECGIPLRKPGVLGPNITKSELKKLYMQKRMSSRKIAKIYKCAYSTVDRKIRQFGFPIQTLAAAHIFTHRANFSGNLKEKAYLIGFRIGDLRVRKIYKNSETIHIDCGSTKPEQIALIKKLFKKYGKIWISKPNKLNKTQIECCVNTSFDFLLKRFDLFPSWTLKTKRLFFSILAGFSDAEGCFSVSKNNDQSYFSIGNYNKNILMQIQGHLSNLGYKIRLSPGVKKGYRGKDGYVHNGDYWVLQINKKVDLYRFVMAIKPYLRHKDKIHEANKVIQNILYRNRRYGYIGMEMLNFGHGQKIPLVNHNFALR